MNKDKLIEILELFLVEHTQELGMKLIEKNIEKIIPFFKGKRMNIEYKDWGVFGFHKNINFPNMANISHFYIEKTNFTEWLVQLRQNQINQIKELL